ncbi:hypothetical protein D3C86_2009750 [compost metagenome]
MVDQSWKGTVRAYPLFWIISHMFLFKFEGGPVPDVVADVLLVGQDLMDAPFGPRPG